MSHFRLPHPRRPIDAVPTPPTEVELIGAVRVLLTPGEKQLFGSLQHVQDLRSTRYRRR